MKLKLREKKVRITVVDTRGLYSSIYDEFWCDKSVAMELVTQYEKYGMICIVEDM